MQLNELVLHNFGAYHGRHVLDLSPPSAKKPVILVGALNGSGKTTILDALQLVLYGPTARCSSRNGTGYMDFLRESIHRRVDDTEGAALELEFSHRLDGYERRIRVHRSWRSTGKHLRERLEVSTNDHQDDVLTEAWREYVETVLPNRLAPLFFFDGEKIEAFVDPERSSQVLGTAIHALLGIDLMDRLDADLLTLEGRKKRSLQDEQERQDLAGAEEARDEASSNKASLLLERAKAQSKLDVRQNRLTDIENRLRAEGGDLFEKRQELEARKEALSAKLMAVEEELRNLAAKTAPLLLVRGALRRVLAQAERESADANAEYLGRVLENRDAQLIARATELGLAPDQISMLGEFLALDRSEREAPETKTRPLALGEDSALELRSLLSLGLTDTRNTVKKLVDRCDVLRSEQVDLDRMLVKVPDREAIASLLEERAVARERVRSSEKALQQLDESLQQARRLSEEADARYRKLIEKQVRADFSQEASARLLRRSAGVRGAIETFRKRLLARHVERIEGFILESARSLIRKKTLIKGLRIDPTDFHLDLLDSRGKLLPTGRLSAGERQLLAVSIIWGLSKASGRRLPAVIDTPLGRLDSVHRRRLIENYFPKASHQVLLLSTDEEIEGEYFRKLERWVGRSYLLEHNDADDSTSVRTGYFD
jgi:DNA sulfur modification protein DndD